MFISQRDGSILPDIGVTVKFRRGSYPSRAGLEVGNICFVFWRVLKVSAKACKRHFGSWVEVPECHYSNRVSAAVNNLINRLDFTTSYRAIMNVYSMHSRWISGHIDVRVNSDHMEIWYGKMCFRKL